MSDDKSGFSLNNVTTGIRSKAAQLAHGDDPTPDAKSVDGSILDDDEHFTVETADYDRTEAPRDDMRQYWRQFEYAPIVRKPITSFASQVVEPGYYIDADESVDSDTVDELEHWLERSAILEAEKYNDWRQFAKKCVVQREVRGTVLVEKVPPKGDEESLAAFKLINPETTEVLTHPNQALLIEPDDTERFESVPVTETGDAAAYLQDISETGQTRWGTPIKGDKDSDNKIAFSQDEIIKITRDADIGEAFGTSRIEAVSDRIEGLRQKLDDNDEAIASKAYPLWLFKFGAEEEPWPRDDINNFMQAHEMDKFHPGMKQGVRGDVSVETVSGEVAEIAEYLDFDVDYILSAMPMPKYALGSFEASAAGQVSAIAQQEDIQRQIDDARRDLEEKFTPAIREKAEELGVDEPDDIRLKIGDPEQPEGGPSTNQQVIRYLGANSGEDSPSESGEDGDTAPADSVESAASVWEAEYGVAELQDVSDGSQKTVADSVFQSMERTRDTVIEAIESKFVQGSASVAAAQYERDANAAIRSGINETAFRANVRPVLREEIDEVYASYDVGNRFSNQQNASFAMENVKNSTRDALDEMVRDFRTLVRRTTGERGDISTAVQQLRSKYDDQYLRTRAELIAQMELQRAVNSAKLRAFERRDDIVGVQVSNEHPSTPLCSNLSNEVAYFDSEDGIGEQFTERTRDAFLHEGFGPVLPEAPPYHYGCDTTFEPVYE